MFEKIRLIFHIALIGFYLGSAMARANMGPKTDLSHECHESTQKVTQSSLLGYGIVTDRFLKSVFEDITPHTRNLVINAWIAVIKENLEMAMNSQLLRVREVSYLRISLLLKMIADVEEYWVYRAYTIRNLIGPANLLLERGKRNTIPLLF